MDGPANFEEWVKEGQVVRSLRQEIASLTDQLQSAQQDSAHLRQQVIALKVGLKQKLPVPSRDIVVLQRRIQELERQLADEATTKVRKQRTPKPPHPPENHPEQKLPPGTVSPADYKAVCDRNADLESQIRDTRGENARLKGEIAELKSSRENSNSAEKNDKKQDDVVSQREGEEVRRKLKNVRKIQGATDWIMQMLVLLFPLVFFRQIIGYGLPAPLLNSTPSFAHITQTLGGPMLRDHIEIKTEADEVYRDIFERNVNEQIAKPTSIKSGVAPDVEKQVAQVLMHIEIAKACLAQAQASVALKELYYRALAHYKAAYAGPGRFGEKISSVIYAGVLRIIQDHVENRVLDGMPENLSNFLQNIKKETRFKSYVIKNLVELLEKNGVTVGKQEKNDMQTLYARIDRLGNEQMMQVLRELGVTPNANIKAKIEVEEEYRSNAP